MNCGLTEKEGDGRASAAAARPAGFSSASPSAGFALLFAILAASVLLSVAVAIWNIALREVILSSFGRESQIAFFAADTGSECALYWDFKGAFATSTDTDLPRPNQKRSCPTAFPAFITCGGEIIHPIITFCNDFKATTDFSMTMKSGTCADVTVTKTDPTGSGVSATDIDSRGHNTCDPTNPIYVERGLRTNY